MSWKGFSKGVQRTPQTIKQRFNMGDNTKDPIYLDAERRFMELEQETKKLHDESKKYFDAINSMLNHQIGFSQSIAEIYKPISGRVSDPETHKVDGNPEGIEACEQYKTVVEDLKASLAPELEMIETRIIRPADELMEVIKMIRKTATKRAHKQLDYDRFRNTYKKLQEKKERTAKDEKALYQAENNLEQATQEYNYWNDLLKSELPKLFELEREFIRPLFQSFYYMQLNVFYTLHERMQRLNISYFDLSSDIEGAFFKKRGDVQEKAEAFSIVHFKTSGQKASRIGTKFTKYGKKEGEVTKFDPLVPASSSVAARRNTTESADAPPPTYQAAITSNNPKLLLPAPTTVTPKPATSSALTLAKPNVGRSNSTASTFSAVGKPKPPPPPKPKPKALTAQVEMATAMYDFDAQMEGDLGFRAGDVIEIVQRTSNENEWWTGKLRGVVGQFPGNYVKLGS
ncbi:reduced viability upon starvation protein [Kalaharituber pfeilii]|nr:reduced viability upon starvation protein [Kalaharituber pfeilii]